MSGRRCVLLVDDEPLVRMLLADTLDSLGFRVEEAGSATEAISRYRAAGSGIDAAIIDIGLPDRKGDGLALELRAMRKDLPIIISSGYDERTLRDRFDEDDLIRFLGKPFVAEQLEAVMRSLNLVPGKSGRGEDL